MKQTIAYTTNNQDKTFDIAEEKDRLQCFPDNNLTSLASYVANEKILRQWGFRKDVDYTGKPY